MSIPSRALAAALTACLLAPAPAPGAGFALFEQGARAQGFAGAFTAQADDPSAIFHNAAGIAFLKGRQLYLGGTLVAPRSTFEGADPFPGAGVAEETDVGLLVPPAAYYTHQFSRRLVLGLGLHTPFGLRTEWGRPDTFTGRYLATSADLTGFSINPTAAYKLADRLAVGGGLDVRVSSVTLRRRVPVVNPFTLGVVDAAELDLESDTDLSFGFNAGALAKLSDTLAVGLHYRSKAVADYGGGATFTPRPTGNAQLDTRLAALLPQGRQPVATSVEFPAFLTTGVAWSPGDWTLAADVNWYQWSVFRRIVIEFTERPDLSETLVEDYANSLQYRVGAERRFGRNLALRGGYFFDESPSPTESVSPLLPDSDRHGLALGGTWRAGRFTLDAAGWYLFSPARSTEGVNRDRYDGTYKSRALTLGLFVGYSFY